MANENNYPIKVLLTSPSINAKQNIGGISSLTKLLIENNHEIEYIHFVRGKKDTQKRSFMWLLKQPRILLNFLSILMYNKNIRIVHINFPLEKFAIIRDTVLVLISSIFLKKVIVHFHGGNYNMNKNIPQLLKLLAKTSILLADKIIALGHSEVNFFIEYYKVRPEKIIFLYNAVKIPNPPPHKIYNHKLRILYLGRIDQNKGLKEIVLALEMLKEKIDFKFIIAGDGPDKNDFRDECRKRIPENYEYLGIISGEKKERVLYEANIFLMASYYEGFPIALLEAMANKLVPIVTPVGSIPEIVDNGRNGFIVPVHDYKCIYYHLIELINNPQLMGEISENAYNTVKLNFSIIDQRKKLNALYFSLFLNN